MATLDTLDLLYIAVSFLFQIVLIIHFAVRRRHLETAVRYGPIVYALALPAVLLSLVQIAAGKPWTLWLAGLLFGAWAAFGYYVEYVARIEWRAPIVWRIFIPYVTLYLATSMFYWWPLAQLYRPLWFIQGGLFVIATILNVTSHHGPAASEPPRGAMQS
jgi:hypothetical protein